MRACKSCEIEYDETRPKRPGFIHLCDSCNAELLGEARRRKQEQRDFDSSHPMKGAKESIDHVIRSVRVGFRRPLTKAGETQFRKLFPHLYKTGE